MKQYVKLFEEWLNEAVKLKKGDRVTINFRNEDMLNDRAYWERLNAVHKQEYYPEMPPTSSEFKSGRFHPQKPVMLPIGIVARLEDPYALVDFEDTGKLEKVLLADLILFEE